ncbi:hypothetical protein SAMN06295879_2974 [Agreia bicolorata]|uniref:YgjP-like metallopeptidase domain-containing protein n=1 Tax=Agreia bicolorata TaxID=110935 RepID=A0A1T4YEN3_9MICO|nr:SprT family zinc-dependent metalloprotease [Agreia bicolorata]SKB00282.1 hypothetical protein SAMN06295879_2974 [Agreia bicolorata]
MNRSVDYGTRQIAFSLDRRARKTMDITVDPQGDVVVVAPIDTPEEDIAARVRQRGRWIVSQQRYFSQFRPRSTPRQWVFGETHLYLGRQHRLRIGDASALPSVHRSPGVLLVNGVEFNDSRQLQRIVLAWYRQRATELFSLRLHHCIQRFDDRSITPDSMTIRVMNSRWASMSTAGRLSINPLLVRARVSEIDYVITHELVHRAHPHHGPEFWAMLEAVMPDHAIRKMRLERMLS